jgi:hypothetical protein
MCPGAGLTVRATGTAGLGAGAQSLVLWLKPKSVDACRQHLMHSRTTAVAVATMRHDLCHRLNRPTGHMQNDDRGGCQLLKRRANVACNNRVAR